MSIETDTQYYLICDKCGERLGPEWDEEEARQNAVGDDGWECSEGKDLCRKCAEKAKRAK